MNAKRAAKLIKIANYYGKERQVCKLMEELGEASSAASEVLQLLAADSDAVRARGGIQGSASARSRQDDREDQKGARR